MPDIEMELVIKAPAAAVFAGVSTPAGMDIWWTRAAHGEAKVGAEFSLDFGPAYLWRAEVVACAIDREFELRLTAADPEWIGTRVHFALNRSGQEGTQLNFRHGGWAAPTQQWRFSCYCWAVYLRLLRRHLEFGDRIAFGDRLRA